MKSIKTVEFVFENIEYFSIDAKYFGELTIGEFDRCIRRVASNCIADSMIADKVLMEIFPEGDATYDPFEHGEGTKFKRITAWNDITHIELTYDDGTKEYICVNYDEGLNEGKLGAENINQTSMISDLGNLYICVWPGHRVKQEFPEHKINNAEENEVKKDLYFRIDDEIASMSDEGKKAKMAELEVSLAVMGGKSDE